MTAHARGAIAKLAVLLVMVGALTTTARGAVARGRPSPASARGMTMSVTVDQGLAEWAPYASGSGSVSVGRGGTRCDEHCTATVSERSPVTLVAHTGAHATFTGWSGACVGVAPICVIAPSRAAVATAHFAPFLTDVRVVVGGGGEVVSQPAGIACGADATQCVASLPQAMRLELIPLPSDGSAFAGWGGDCPTAGSGPCSISVADGTSVTASFSSGSAPTAGTAQLSLAPDGVSLWTTPSFGPVCASGAVCNLKVSVGTAVLLSDRGDPFAQPAEWSGACIGSGDECVVVVDSAASVTAHSAPPRFGAPPPSDYFEASVSGAGRIVVTGYGRCPAGCAWQIPVSDVVTLTARPGPRARFVTWSGFCQGHRLVCRLKVGPNEYVAAAFRR